MVKKIGSIILYLILFVNILSFNNIVFANTRPARPSKPQVQVIPLRPLTSADYERVRVTYRQVRNTNRTEIQWRRVSTPSWVTLNRNWQSRTISHSRSRNNRTKRWTAPRRFNFNSRYQFRVRGLRVRRVNGRNQTIRGPWSPIRTYNVPSTEDVCRFNCCGCEE